jgi:Type II secretion system (T2SS), protein L
MATLRVLLTAAPDSRRAYAWVLFDDNEAVVRTGRSTPDEWPEAERREAILAASSVRVVGLQLPPMPADRVAAAVSFALEDQLAGPAEEQHIAVSRQHADGMVEAIVANRELAADVAANFDRVLAEPTLAPRPQEALWNWYASGADGGFVRKPDGSAFATSDQQGIPVEIMLALDHATHAGGRPVEIGIAFAVDETTRAELARQAGTRFVQAAGWQWGTAGREAFAAATDLRQGDFAPGIGVSERGSARLFRIAAAVALSAIALHVVATFGEWAALRVDAWRARTALASLAREAGANGTDSPAVEIARRYAEARHRAGLAAPADALPLLARAAPALAALPAGTIRNAIYADGHWTFDLARSDSTLTNRLERQLANAGLATLQASGASGARLRVSLGTGGP